MEIFNNVDALIYGQGETPFNCLANNIPFEEIPGIIWKNSHDNKVILNLAQKENSNLDFKNFKELNIEMNYKTTEKNDKYAKKFEFCKPNYDGIDFEEYFLPQKIITLESSRGCYWNKCEFCLFSDGTPYKQKNINDLIEEIKEYINKYNVHKFYFSDSAIHPEYEREFSTKILENKLKIQYTTFLRLENLFDYNLLKLMYDAGLRIALWGVESGSDKILQIYKKGTTVENNAKVLKTASEIGISNFCWIIVRFPNETIEDLELTKNFILKNRQYINKIQFHDFAFYKYAPMSSHLEDFGINQNIFDGDDNIIKGFIPSIEIETYAKSLQNELKKIYKNNILFYGNLSNVMIELSKIKI